MPTQGSARSTSSGGNASIKKQGHTTTGRHGEGFDRKGGVVPAREVSPKG